MGLTLRRLLGHQDLLQRVRIRAEVGIAYGNAIGLEKKAYDVNIGLRRQAARIVRWHDLPDRIEHLRTRPYRPRTNGKAERFIQTMLREWAYAAVYRTSTQRALALRPWLDYYNQRRPHGALSHKPPITRLDELNNLARSYS